MRWVYRNRSHEQVTAGWFLTRCPNAGDSRRTVLQVQPALLRSETFAPLDKEPFMSGSVLMNFSGVSEPQKRDPEGVAR